MFTLLLARTSKTSPDSIHSLQRLSPHEIKFWRILTKKKENYLLVSGILHRVLKPLAQQTRRGIFVGITL